MIHELGTKIIKIRNSNFLDVGFPHWLPQEHKTSISVTTVPRSQNGCKYQSLWIKFKRLEKVDSEIYQQAVARKLPQLRATENPTQEFPLAIYLMII